MFDLDCTILIRWKTMSNPYIYAIFRIDLNYVETGHERL